jgi:hypothetical protein
MSLIICSSSQEEYTKNSGAGAANNESSQVMQSMNGLSSPATFTNFMRSPILLDPNSEVAVQSVRIQRDPVYTVTDTSVAYKYTGREIGSSVPIRDSVWAPLPVRMREGNYTPSGFREKFEEALSDVKLPGQTWEITSNACATTQSASLSQGGHMIEVKEASGVGAGGDWINCSNCSESLVDADWEAYLTEPVYTFSKSETIPKSDNYTISSVNTGQDTIARNFATPGVKSFDHKSMAILKRPIMNSSGIMRFRCKSLPDGGKFAMGLTRATQMGPFNGSGLSSDFNLSQMGLAPESMATNGEPGRDGWEYIYQRLGSTSIENASAFLGPLRDSGNNVFYDFVCELSTTDLRVYQYVKDDTEERGTMKEVQYWNSTGVNNLTTRILNASFGATAQAAGTGYADIQWTLRGDRLELRLLSEDGLALDTVLVDPLLNASKVHTFVPIGSTKSALYPKVQMTNMSSGFSVFDCGTTDPNLTGGDAWKYPAGGTGGVVAGSDYWSCNFWAKQPRFLGSDEEWIYNGPPVMPGLNGLSNWNYVMDTRDVYRWNSATDLTAFATYMGNVNASYGFSAAEVLLLSQQDKNKDSGNYLIEYNNIQPANLAGPLGFGGVLGLLVPGNSHQLAVGVHAHNSWRSRVEPDLLVSSAFVKLRNGPQTSYNAGLGSISKILYHVPRFTNDGRQYGDLFFECGEKTYVAMKNTDRVILNSLDIDIVDRNDRIVKDLTGSTIVVLHIRKR